MGGGGLGADVWCFPDEINGICITSEANDAQVEALMRRLGIAAEFSVALMRKADL